MNTQAAIAHFGSVQKLAAALGIGRAAVYQWGSAPPIDRQCQIEVITGGVLRADGVERQDNTGEGPSTSDPSRAGCTA